MPFLNKLKSVLKISKKIHSTEKVLEKFVPQVAPNLFSGTKNEDSKLKEDTISKNSFDFEKLKNGSDEGTNLRTRLEEQTDKLFESSFSTIEENVLKTKDAEKKLSPVRGSGVVSFEMKQNRMPLGDALEPLVNNIAIITSPVFPQQAAHVHQMAKNPILNATKADVSQMSKRMESIHSDRKTLDFICPLPLKERKKSHAKHGFRKMDCASLKEEALKNEMNSTCVIPPKEKSFGCRKNRVEEEKPPNSCGVVFHCPKREEPKKKETGPCIVSRLNIQPNSSHNTENENQFSFTVSQIKDQCCQHVKALVEGLCPRNEYLDEESLALAVTQIVPIGCNATPQCFDKFLSVFENASPRAEYSIKVRKMSDSQGSKREFVCNVVPSKAVKKNVNFHARSFSDSKLKITDSELKRISMNRLPQKAAEITMAGHIMTSPTLAKADESSSKKDSCGSSGSGANDKSKSRFCPSGEDKKGESGEKNAQDKWEKCEKTQFDCGKKDEKANAVDCLKGEAGPPKTRSQSKDDTTLANRIDCSATKDDNRNKLKESGSKDAEFKPDPKQVCCPTGEETVEVREEKKQICCPPKDKSKKDPQQAQAKECPPLPEAPRPKSEPVQAEKDPKPKMKEPSPFNDKKPRLDSKSKGKGSRKGNGSNEDPNVFNCCLSIVAERKVEVANCPMPELTDNNVIIKMHTVGICASDVYLFDKGATGKEHGPIVLGHEGSGIVYKVGKKVKHLKPGDGVVVEPGIPCGRCSQCKAGRYNLCSKMKFNSLLQTYCAHSGPFCYKVPKAMNLEHAALAHPVSLGAYACRKSKITVGSKVLVLGACPLGLASVMSARAMGADKIAVIDTLEKNLKVAYDLCADKTILATHEMDCEELVDKVCCEMKGQPNVVIDCCGCTKTFNLALLALQRGGRFVMAGCQAECANLPILTALAKELSICSSFRTSNMFPQAMSLIESGRANVEKLITHRAEFCDAQNAFDWASDEEKSGAIKVLVNWPHTVRK